MAYDDTLLQAMDIVDSTKNTVSLLKSVFGRNSINRMAKDSMLQTPVIADSSIDSQTLAVINKCIERRTAAILTSVFSLHPYVSLKKFGSIGNYIKTIYDNDKSPIALPSTDSDMSIPEDAVSVTEAAILKPGEFKVNPQIEFEYLIGTEAALNMNDINSIYNGSVINVNRMADIVAGMEANQTRYNVDGSHPNRYKGALANNPDGSLGGAVATAANVMNRVQDSMSVSNTEPMKGPGPGAPKIDSKAIGSFDPTLITVTFSVQPDKGGQIITRQVVLGMQAVMRTMKYDDMVNTLMLAAKGSVEAFKLVRYLTGERKLADFLLGIADSKEMARPNTVGGKLLASLKQRKKTSNFKKFSGGAKPLPITWLVVSSAAVDEVKNATGIDLAQPYFATKMIDEYYLLGFIIIDESLGHVKIIMDGDNAFTETTLRALKNTNDQKYDMANQKDILALMAGKL